MHYVTIVYLGWKLNRKISVHIFTENDFSCFITRSTRRCLRFSSENTKITKRHSTNFYVRSSDLKTKILSIRQFERLYFQKSLGYTTDAIQT